MKAKTISRPVYVAFHIGRGGRFYNQGHKAYEGEMDFRQVCTMLSDSLFDCDRDERGRFRKPYLKDSNGSVVSEDNPNGHTGVIDFDGDYDTWVVRELDGCDDDEIRLIYKSRGHRSPELTE